MASARNVTYHDRYDLPSTGIDRAKARLNGSIDRLAMAPREVVKEVTDEAVAPLADKVEELDGHVERLDADVVSVDQRATSLEEKVSDLHETFVDVDNQVAE